MSSFAPSPSKRSCLFAAVTRASTLLVAATALCHPSFSFADDFRGLTIEEALNELRQRGLDILYSSDVIQPSMRVRDEPRGTEARAILVEILAPYGVAVQEGPGGLLLLVRSAPSESSGKQLTADQAPPASTLEEVIVSASHYQFVRELTFPLTVLSASDLLALPDLGDDPLRAAGRLPGAASSDFSSKVNVRGGEVDETLVRFDGLRLQNPFHLKDFQSTFSTIDPGVVSGMRVYAGGFPVSFGDRMSGVIDIDSLSGDEPGYNEIALSFFNASALTAGRTSDERGEWLLAARRGNLDLLVNAVNSSIGEPKYVDFYGRAGRQITDAWTASANALVSDDVIVLFDSDHEEEARAEYRDAYYWLRFDYQPSATLSGDILVARSDLDSERLGRADQEGIGRGRLSDERSFTITSLQSDWSARLREHLLLQFGGEWRGMQGRYDYQDEAEFDLLFDTPGAPQETERERNISLRPDGDHYALYANLRVEPTSRLTADAGLRWDRETLTPDPSDQLSPRLSLLYSLGERTRLRASWGRYFQTQSINELQASDGVTEFFPPQRANHLIASIEHQYARGLEMRIEAYRKDYQQVRPRFENLLNTFVLLPELKPDRIRIAPDRARATGVELSLRQTIGRSFNWWASYTWSSVEDDFGGMRIPRSWDQPHLVSGGVAWRNERWELSLAAAWHTGWPTSELTLIETEETPIVATSQRNEQRLDDYRTLDLRVARTFDLSGAGALTVFLEVNNVMNRSNDCCVEYEVETEESEEMFLDVSRRSYLPITPSLGVVWRF
jgi:outer membrane receptor protein involved in Fe transport